MINQSIVNDICEKERVIYERKFHLPQSDINYDEIQRDIVAQALTMTNSNQCKAARLLGITRARFRTLLKLYNTNKE